MNQETERGLVKISFVSEGEPFIEVVHRADQLIKEKEEKGSVLVSTEIILKFERKMTLEELYSKND